MKWKRYLRAELLFSLSLIAFSLFFIIEASGYSHRNRVFPESFGIACLVLSLIFLVKYVRKANRWTDEEIAAYKFDWRPVAVSAILALYTVGTYYLGILIATCLFNTLFIYFWGRQKLWIALTCSGVAFFAIYVVFEVLMQMQMYRGVLRLFY